jgi:hypothetical protein
MNPINGGVLSKLRTYLKKHEMLDELTSEIELE